MTQTNYEILKEDREATLEFAKSVAETRIGESDLEIDKKLDNAHLAFKTHDYEKAILLLQEARDNKIGIEWVVSDNLGSGKKTLVRDARNISKNEEDLTKEFGENYLILLISQGKSANDLISHSEVSDKLKNELKKKLDYTTERAFDDIEELPNKIEDYNREMLKIMEEAKIKHPKKELVFAKQIDTFKYEHFNTVTISKVPTKDNDLTVIESDVIVPSITDNQKEQYKKILQESSKDNYTIDES